MGELYESIREFLVAVDEENRVIGCVALHVFWEDLAELKCLAVTGNAQGQGVGRRLVDACWEAARELEIASVFALTYSVGFFERCGYHQLDKAELPHRNTGTNACAVLSSRAVRRSRSFARTNRNRSMVGAAMDLLPAQA